MSTKAAFSWPLGPKKMSVTPPTPALRLERFSNVGENKKLLPWHRPFWISATEQMPIARPHEQLFHGHGAKMRANGLKSK